MEFHKIKSLQGSYKAWETCKGIMFHFPDLKSNGKVYISSKVMEFHRIS